MIFLTFSPTKIEKERICGHTFEIIDYYLLLKDLGYKVKIIFLDKFKDKEKIFKAWEDKYIINFNYKKDVEFKNLNLNKKNNIILNGTVIITSGIDDYWNQLINIYAKKIISFQCEEYDYSKYLQKPNFYLLRDERLYNNKNYSSKTFNYIKKIYFKRFKKINKTEDNTLIYINSHLKDLSIEKLEKLKKYKNLLFISGTKLNNNQINKYKKYGKLLFAPVENIFEKFETFLYTNNTRNFDCSPRFIAECFFYKKNIIIDFDINQDIGAYWRWQDIQNNFNSLVLDKNDFILKVLNE